MRKHFSLTIVTLLHLYHRQNGQGRKVNEDRYACHLQKGNL